MSVLLSSCRVSTHWCVPRCVLDFHYACVCSLSCGYIHCEVKQKEKYFLIKFSRMQDTSCNAQSVAYVCALGGGVHVDLDCHSMDGACESHNMSLQFVSCGTYKMHALSSTRAFNCSRILTSQL